MNYFKNGDFVLIDGFHLDIWNALAATFKADGFYSKKEDWHKHR